MQARSNPDRIPVTILTGFLGSGKTTLLNKLLRESTWADSAVVVNEFGDIGLDHLLITEGKENVVLMDAGCLCCAVLDSLPATLIDLFHRRTRGQVPSFRRVLIETSGLAEPAPIMRSLMRDPLVSHFYRLQGLLCTVDALFAERELNQHPEARAQIALADRLIMTKMDMTGGRIPEALEHRLLTLNPRSSRVPVDSADIAMQLEGTGAIAPWLGSLDGEGHDHEHSVEVGSESLVVDEPLAWPGVAAWIEHLREFHATNLLRCKGLLNVAGSPVVLHGVQNVFDTKIADHWPDEDRRSRIVLIGRGLRRSEIVASLALLMPAG